MLSTVSQPVRSTADPALDAMFEARKRVFVDLLKWDVPVVFDRYEIDEFDELEPTYIVLMSEGSQHRASARLLRTERPHILDSLFPELCDNAIPRSAGTWEITRFCIDPRLSRTERRTARDQLVTALVEHALRRRIAHYTAVASLAWFDQIARFGWSCSALGPPTPIGRETLIAMHIAVDATTPDKLRRSGVYLPCKFRTVHAGEPT